MVLKEFVTGSLQKRGIPFKRNLEAGPGLILRCRMMRIINLQVNLRMRGQSAVPGTEVLNGMRRQDSYFVFCRHVSSTFRSFFSFARNIILTTNRTGVLL